MFDIFGEEKKRRKYISKADEDKLLEKQKWKCARCGKILRPGRYHLDHKKPLALGGTNSIRNLQALCPDCHHIKTKEDKKKIARTKKKEKNVFGLSVSSSKRGRKKKDEFALDVPDIFGGGKKSKRKKRKKKDEFGFDLF
jgi:hypothetical protein